VSGRVFPSRSGVNPRRNFAGPFPPSLETVQKKSMASLNLFFTLCCGRARPCLPLDFLTPNSCLPSEFEACLFPYFPGVGFPSRAVSFLLPNRGLPPPLTRFFFNSRESSRTTTFFLRFGLDHVASERLHLPCCRRVRIPSFCPANPSR